MLDSEFSIVYWADICFPLDSFLWPQCLGSFLLWYVPLLQLVCADTFLLCLLVAVSGGIIPVITIMMYLMYNVLILWYWIAVGPGDIENFCQQCLLQVYLVMQIMTCNLKSVKIYLWNLIFIILCDVSPKIRGKHRLLSFKFYLKPPNRLLQLIWNKDSNVTISLSLKSKNEFRKVIKSAQVGSIVIKFHFSISNCNGH